jgi:Zn-dependent peptidase ImmA (M78 family)
LNRVRANQIVAKALQTRKKFLSVEAHIPICPFNLAEAMGIDIRFVKISSFEGMYLADEGMILIASERPEGRKRFTCAHEIGHHVLGHGTVIDEIIESGSDKEIEKEADFFGSMLLMPSSAVKRAAGVISFDFAHPAPSGLYILSRYLGTSYVGLVTQLYFNLKCISGTAYQSLKSVPVRSIKNSIYPDHGGGEIFVVGDWWKEKSIDLVVGDFIVASYDLDIEGEAVSVVTSKPGQQALVAKKPGIAKITDANGWSAFVRVSRKGYSGMNQYRHEEEVE